MGEKDKAAFVREATGLVRGISPFGAFVAGMLVVGLPSTIWVLYDILPAIFPQANTLVLTLTVAVPAIVWASVYLFFNMAMPRSGGDYVWVSRTIHPAIGLMENFYIFFFSVTSLGLVASLVTLFGVGFFQMSGIAFQNPGLVTLSESVSTPLNASVLGIVTLVVFALISLSGIRNVQRVQVVFWVLGFIGVLAFIVSLLSTPNSVFISNVDKAFGSGGYNNFISVAETNGFKPGWSLEASLAALPFGILGVMGFNWALYSGGELKNTVRSSWAASIIPILFTLGFFLIIGYALYGSYGYDFSAATGYLDNVNPSAITPGSGAAAAPLAIPWVYSVFTNANPYVISFIGFAFMVGEAVALLPIFTLITRVLFVYSFDRVIPERFSQVSSRFHTPVFSILFSTVVGIPVIIIANETSFFGTYLTNTTIGYIIATLIVGFAAIKFPYGKTKQMFENSPALVRKKVAGIPLMTVSGIVTVIVFIYLTIAAFRSPARGGLVSPSSFIVGLLIPFALPVLLYYIAKSYRKSRGVDLNAVFGEIPPE